MSEEFKLKAIHADAIPEALITAEKYRLLNEPVQAESICRDILRIDPQNQPALQIIILVLTDQFSKLQTSPGARTARDYAARLADAYLRSYYLGLICERQARALLSGMGGKFAYDGFREAMDHFEEAEKIRPSGHDDAILRWNSCVRTIRRHKLRPRSKEEEQEMFLE